MVKIPQGVVSNVVRQVDSAKRCVCKSSVVRVVPLEANEEILPMANFEQRWYRDNSPFNY